MLNIKKRWSLRCADAVLSTQAYNQASLRIINDAIINNGISHYRDGELKPAKPVPAQLFEVPVIRQTSHLQPCHVPAY
ncbi:MAG: hypothetical protein ACOYNF_13515 [Rhodoferax sp.]